MEITLADLRERFRYVDEKSGFLNASEPPSARISDLYYAPWEELVSLLPALLLASRVRPYVDATLPDLEIKEGTSLRDINRIYTILSFIVHAYVRGGVKEQPLDMIPSKLAVPFKKSAEILGIKPIVTYTSTTLLNWSLLESGEPVSLSNLRCVNTITGSPDEAWFYLVAVAMEAQGGPILCTILDLHRAACLGDITGFKAGLISLTSHISRLEATLERMYENNIPTVFYKRIRRYLSGWTNDPSLPEGLHYGPESPGERYSGASAAQSPLIQCLDDVLGIQHPVHEKDEAAVSERTRVGTPGQYLSSMRDYMLKEHRECLAFLKEHINIRRFVEQHVGDLQEAFNGCILAMESFRTSHIRMVTLYVVSQAAKENESVRGTGGSNPIPFLKEIRAQTQHTRL